MYNQNQHLADNAKVALENNRRQQEERRLAMVREQKTRELKQLETQLFYKKQEVARLKSLSDRLRRESTLRKNTDLKERHELASNERLLKETEAKVKQLEQDVNRSISDIADKISKEKSILLQHQKNLEDLEKQKRDIEGKKETGKRTLLESVSRILFFRKKEQQDVQHADQLLESNQLQLHQIEQSLKTFSQEVTVLENKIRTLRGVMMQ